MCRGLRNEFSQLRPSWNFTGGSRCFSWVGGLVGVCRSSQTAKLKTRHELDVTIVVLKMHHEDFGHLIKTDANAPQRNIESNATDVDWKALGSEFVIRGSSKHVPWWCNGVIQAETWVKIKDEHQRPSDRWTMPMYWIA